MSRYKKQRAFTLIEVLVALAIFALCAALLSAQSTSTLHNRQRLMEQQIALWVAQDRLAEIRIDNRLMVAREQALEESRQESMEVVQMGIHWMVGNVIESTADKQLKKVTVSVSRQSRDAIENSPAVQLTAFLAD